MNYDDLIKCPKCGVVVSRKRYRLHIERDRCDWQHIRKDERLDLKKKLKAEKLKLKGALNVKLD